MKEQLELIPGPARARRSDPQTSHDAAASMTEHLTKLEEKILQAIRASKRGMTIDELTVQLGIEKVTISPRLKPMCRKGVIYSDGRKRRGRSGRPGLIFRECVNGEGSDQRFS